MPPEIVDTLNKAVEWDLEGPQVKARLAEWGATALADSPAEFAKFIADETEKWGKVIPATNFISARARLTSVHYTSAVYEVCQLQCR